jgi:DNA polymerase-3 subunit alpha
VPYIPLFSHSLLNSALSLDALIQSAIAWNLPAIGLMDSNTLSGAVQFYEKARAVNLHPVIGAHVSLPSGAFVLDNVHV